MTYADILHTFLIPAGLPKSLDATAMRVFSRKVTIQGGIPGVW